MEIVRPPQDTDPSLAVVVSIRRNYGFVRNARLATLRKDGEAVEPTPMRRYGTQPEILQAFDAVEYFNETLRGQLDELCDEGYTSEAYMIALFVIRAANNGVDHTECLIKAQDAIDNVWRLEANR